MTVRSRISDHLHSNGPITDRSGRATAILKQAVGYTGGDAGFSRVVGLMEEAGELSREIRGKRTYRIEALGERPASLPAATTSAAVASGTTSGGAGGELDFDELAATLLARVVHVLSAAEGSEGQGDAAGWARRRIDLLEAKVAGLERDLARARAETQAMTAERDALAAQLEAASHNLELLTERLNEPKRPANRAADRLDSEEQALLYRLRDRRGKPAPPRAG
jgi:hypothetical protein